jgi:hypothetical protein
MEMCGGGSNGCLFITICACQITYRKSDMDTVQLRQMDTVQETERVRQMIGTEDEFSAKMSSDPMYQPALILRRRSSPQA